MLRLTTRRRPRLLNARRCCRYANPVVGLVGQDEGVDYHILEESWEAGADTVLVKEGWGAHKAVSEQVHSALTLTTLRMPHVSVARASSARLVASLVSSLSTSARSALLRFVQCA